MRARQVEHVRNTARSARAWPTERRTSRTVVVAVLGLAASAALGGCASTAGAREATGTASASARAADERCGDGATVAAEGSSAQENAIEQAIISFAMVCPDVAVTYDATGSGAGVAQFTAGEVAFAGSDSALNPDKGEVDAALARCEAGPAWNIPMVTGPIAVAYNAPTILSLVLDAPTIAGIFRGDITTWDDPAIAALNPDERLPAQDIQVVHRADSSGTTDNFTRYLAAASGGVWADEPGKVWPEGAAGEGHDGSSGVAAAVATTPGAITYVEWSHARENQLGVVEVETGAGPVELTTASASAAVASAERVGEGDDLTLALDYATREPGAYPIILVTYEVVCSAGLDPGTAAGVKAFLTHLASSEFQDELVDIGYAPLPDGVRADVQEAIRALS